MRFTGRRAALAVLLASVLAGCGGEPEAAYNETDVMFLQMGLAQNAEGDRVARLTEMRAANPEIRAVAEELRTAWRAETPMMRGWLQDWGKPLEVAPDEGLHAGHGALHALREEDFTGLAEFQGSEFDRAAVALLLGNLHNGMETIRMQVEKGSYPQAVDLAEDVTAARQGQIQRLLALSAG